MRNIFQSCCPGVALQKSKNYLHPKGNCSQEYFPLKASNFEPQHTFYNWPGSTGALKCFPHPSQPARIPTRRHAHPGKRSASNQSRFQKFDKEEVNKSAACAARGEKRKHTAGGTNPFEESKVKRLHIRNNDRHSYVCQAMQGHTLAWLGIPNVFMRTMKIR